MNARTYVQVTYDSNRWQQLHDGARRAGRNVTHARPLIVATVRVQWTVATHSGKQAH